jgi:hypothetical protein
MRVEARRQVRRVSSERRRVRAPVLHETVTRIEDRPAPEMPLLLRLSPLDSRVTGESGRAVSKDWHAKRVSRG